MANSKLEKILKTTGKILAGIGIAGSLYFGNFHNAKGFFPFYTRVTGTTYGIPLGFYVSIDKGAKLYGAAVGLITINNGEIKGGQIGGLINGANPDSKLTGISIGLLGNGFEKDSKMKGVQLGLINLDNGEMKGMQLGIYNRISKSREGLIFNANSQDNSYNLEKSTEEELK